jgi:hypothetical protein
MLIVGMTSDTGMRQRISPHIRPPGFWPSVSPNRVILGALTRQRSASHRDVEELPAGRLPPCMSSSSTAGGIRVVFSELVYGVLAAKRRGVVM